MCLRGRLEGEAGTDTASCTAATVTGNTREEEEAGGRAEEVEDDVAVDAAGGAVDAAGEDGPVETFLGNALFFMSSLIAGMPNL